MPEINRTLLKSNRNGILKKQRRSEFAKRAPKLRSLEIFEQGIQTSKDSARGTLEADIEEAMFRAILAEK